MTTAREKHIQYAQLRRDNENEAREELERRLPFSISAAASELQSRGDLTRPAKAMVAALLYFAPSTELGKPVSRRGFGEGRAREYAKLRRDNEVEARDALAAVIPPELRDQWAERTDFNQTTKVIIAAARYFDLVTGGASAAAAAAVRGSEDEDDDEMKAKDEGEEMGHGGQGQGQRRGAGCRYTKLNSSIEKSDGEGQLMGFDLVPCATKRSFLRTEVEQKLVSETSQPVPSPPSPTNPINEMESAGARKVIKSVTPTKIATPLSRGKKRAREEEADVLADLRRDEREQEGIVLDVKPPCRTRFGGVKTVHPFVESMKKLKKARALSSRAAEIDVSTIPELQALQMTATRLVKKAEEVAVANGGVEDELRTIVADAHDFMIDLIALLEQGGKKQREMRKKWDAKKDEWEERGVEFQEG